MHTEKNSIPLFLIFVLILTFTVMQLGHAAEKGDKRLGHDIAGEKVGVPMRILWTISNYHIGKDAKWGTAEAEKMLFKPLDIDSSTITFNGKNCHDVVFAIDMVNAEQYLKKKYQITPQTLGLKNRTIEVIKSNCGLPGFDEFIRLPDRRLIVRINGVLFVFQPVVNY